MNALYEAILSRRSVREYDPHPVDPALVTAVLQAGLHAPSAHDSRPWHFTVCTGKGKDRLLSALAVPFRRDLEASGLPPEAVAARLARSQRIFRSAPVLILGFVSTRLPANPLDPGGRLEETLAIQSTALAGGQLLLAAQALGLGACWFAAPLFCPAEVCRACEMDPADWRPQYLITFGYPAPGSAPKPKPPVTPEGVITFQA